MTQNYPSFAGGDIPEPYYDRKELEADGFVLKVRCNKTNPDCQKFISDREGEVKIIDLDPAVNQDYKNMVDIWVKKPSESVQ